MTEDRERPPLPSPPPPIVARSAYLMASDRLPGFAAEMRGIGWLSTPQKFENNPQLANTN